MSTVRISGLITNKANITVYFEDGGSRVLPKDSWKTEEIIKQIIPKIAVSEIAEVDLDAFQVTGIMEAVTKGASAIVMAVINKAGDAMSGHVEDIASGRSEKGLKNFMRLYSKTKVKHSAEELMTFMRQADLPLADDGSIIGYKILNETQEKGVYVDVHSGTVKQKLGSLVYMPHSKVSDNRRSECGTGLHVCSRDYIRSFGGHALTLVKVRPNDVVRVPTNEGSKMGCAAYQIVAVIPQELHASLRAGNALESTKEGRKLLEEVMGGVHPPISSKVLVGSFKQEKGYETTRKEGRIEEPVAVHVKAPKKTKTAAKLTLRRVTGGLSVADIKKLHRAALDKRPAQRSPSEVKIVEYEKKLAKAKTLIKKGMSLREAAMTLKIDRNKLSDNLGRGR